MLTSQTNLRPDSIYFSINSTKNPHSVMYSTRQIKTCKQI